MERVTGTHVFLGSYETFITITLDFISNVNCRLSSMLILRQYNDKGF